jgi:hypothetical protein
MGFNTTVVILNDALHDIEDDKDFGAKLVSAILSLSVKNGPVDVRAGNHCNAALVVETHHADMLVPVVVGGNWGTEIKDAAMYYENTDEARSWQLLQNLAEKLGYRLVKKAKP